VENFNDPGVTERPTAMELAYHRPICGKLAALGMCGAQEVVFIPSMLETAPERPACSGDQPRLGLRSSCQASTA